MQSFSSEYVNCNLTNSPDTPSNMRGQYLLILLDKLTLRSLQFLDIMTLKQNLTIKSEWYSHFSL